MDNYTRLFDLIYYQNQNFPQDICFATKLNGKWVKYSTQEVIDTINKLSLGLIEYGIKPGDKVAIISSTNRAEWNLIDLACLQIGAIDVPIYPTISPAEYEYIFNDAGVKIAFVSDQELLDKVDEIKQNVSTLQEVFSFDELSTVKKWTYFTEIAKNEHADTLASIKESIKPDDLATLIYTSGTTGKPKGVMLSHRNITENIACTVNTLPIEPGDKCLSFLPLCHVFERMVTYSYLASGSEIWYAEGIDKIGDNLREVKPHFFTTVPRLLEKVYDKIVSKGLELKGVKRAIFFWALKLGLNYDFDKRSALYNRQLKLAQKLVFSKWQEALGGNLKGIVCGSAPLQGRLVRVFEAAGIQVREGYGLTETAPGVAYNRFREGGVKVGSVGIPLENVEVKIAEDGEILLKGPNIMQGYYNLPEENAKVFTTDGWFKTGDIGEFDGEFLVITDRKKQLLKTSNGKYVAPQHIESKFKESMLIEQMMVVGEGQKFVSALVVPSFDNLKHWCENHHIDTNCTNEELLSKQKVIDKFNEITGDFNKEFSKTEQVKKIYLLPKEFTIESGELTPTMKKKRKNILNRYQKEIDSIYNA